MFSARKKIDCMWLWAQLALKATDAEGRQDNVMTPRKGNVSGPHATQQAVMMPEKIAM